MALTSEFVLSPMNPFASGYDSSHPDAPWAFGHMASWGGMTFSTTPGRLSDQAGNDELLLGYAAVDPSDHAPITNPKEQIFRRNAIRMDVALRNMKGDEQVLLVFGLKRWQQEAAVVQFFLGTEFLRAETIDDPSETMALLVDAPQAGTSWVTVYLRVAGESDGQWWAKALFTGVEVFIL